jgi:indole-3-acetate monooxygenase
MGGCVVERDGSVETLPSGRPDIRLCLFPASEAEVIDTWRVSGLRGTGSHDMSVSDLGVPEERSASLITGRPLEEGPLYAFPVFGTLAIAVAAVALGIARGALDEAIALAAGKTPTGSTRLLAERATTQAQLARAEASMRSARAFLLETIATAWEAARADGEVPLRDRALLRLASTQATHASALAVDVAHELGGGSSIYESSPLERRFRDVHAATQHMAIAPATWELAGRVLLDLPTDPSLL